MLQLQFVGSSKAPVWLVKSITTIGCSSTCDILLKHPSIDTKHAEFLLENEQLWVVPIAKVHVNGNAVSEKSLLKHSDSLRLGEIELSILDPKQLRQKNNISQTDQSGDVRWALQGRTTALANKRFYISNTAVVGRAKECEIYLAVTHLSRQHARLTVTDSGLTVEDLQSANGTFVNGEKQQKATVNHGDEISFDTLTFTVIAPGMVTEDDGDKTSLRPVLTPAMLKKEQKIEQSTSSLTSPQSHASAPLHKSGAKRGQQSSVKPTTPTNMQKQNKPAAKAISEVMIKVPLGVSVGLVCLLTATIIIYLLS